MTIDDVDVLGGMSGHRPGREDVLDNPVWHALAGDHAGVAERVGRAARYLPDVSVFAGLEDLEDDHAWADAARLAGPGGSIVTAGAGAPPAGWQTRFSLPGVQMVATALESEPDPEAVRLGPADVPEMLDLIARTDPGPFRERTIELGAYLGIRRDGALVAMAGERLSLPGWTEVSAVCTDPAHRGQGLAARLVRAVAAGIEERGRTPILHAAEANVNAIRLYEKLGFALRRPIIFAAFEVSS